MIHISKLPLITTPQQFFDADKVLMCDVFHIDQKAHPELARVISRHSNCIKYAGELFFKLALKGSPENMYLNLKRRGIPYIFGNGVESFFTWDGDLTEAIRNQKIYDFTACNARQYKQGEYQFATEDEFMLNRYVFPFMQRTSYAKK